MEKIKHLETKFSIASYELIKVCEPNELRFYLWLKLWAINKNSAWPSMRTIRTDLGMSFDTISKLTKKMEKSGRLVVSRDHRKRNVYDITWYDSVAQNLLQEMEHTAPEPGAKSAPEPGTQPIEIKRIENNNNLQAEPASISKVLEIFQPLNSRSIYGNKTQREATKRLLARLGEEKLLRIAKAVIAHQGARFCPVVTSPYELEQKMGKVAIYFKKESTPKKLIMGIA